MGALHRFAGVLAVVLTVSCGPPRSLVGDGGRDVVRSDGPPPDTREWPTCFAGEERCYGDIYQRCVAAGEFTEVRETDCGAMGQVCVPQRGCLVCYPNSTRCSADDLRVEQCRPDGSGWETTATCDLDRGEACRNARCVVLCEDGSIVDTNIGCEYYAVDLDNAVTGDGRSAASQQYAVVVSNPDAHLTARVRIEWNTAPVGMPPRPATVASAVIGPMDLEVFPLPAREVDCSMPGTFNTGTGTCLSSQAYRITSTIPVIAYQFNPLQNSGVFSNDASLLVPSNSLRGDYVVLGWPQTIADTDDPATDFNENLRAFVTIVGTADNSRVRVTPTTRVIPSGPTGPLPMGAAPGSSFEVTLGRFDVLNLETGAFGADFTGTRIVPITGAVAVFSGSEASDSPPWTSLSERSCCADHLEEQIYPRRTAGSDYVAVRMPSRTAAVRAAGGNVAVVNEPQWFRIVAVGSGITHVETTLPRDQEDPRGPTVSFDLMPGQQRTLRAFTDFEIHADGPLAVATVTGSQQTTGIPFDLPGGDPSFIMIPPIQQWRQNYVFLTPDQYAFDFVTIVAKPTAQVTLDDTPLPYSDCTVQRADACVDRPGLEPCPPPNWVVYRCQLSFPQIDTRMRPPVRPGRQADGVHVVTSDDRENGVMVIVSGFDAFVGYGYPAGTRTVTIN